MTLTLKTFLSKNMNTIIKAMDILAVGLFIAGFFAPIDLKGIFWGFPAGVGAGRIIGSYLWSVR